MLPLSLSLLSAGQSLSVLKMVGTGEVWLLVNAGAPQDPESLSTHKDTEAHQQPSPSALSNTELMATELAGCCAGRLQPPPKSEHSQHPHGPLWLGGYCSSYRK